LSASEIENLIGFIAAVVITVYLIYALVRPEKF
jgi:K+-transporting ATPase KdpF subunit